METLIKDLKYALRLLRRDPGFAAVVVLALALGIGANTAIFSIVDTVLLSPLPFQDPDRVVQLMISRRAGNSNVVSIPAYMAWKAQTGEFERVAAYNVSGAGFNLTGSIPPERLKGMYVSSDYFQLFDAPVAFGRVFSAADDQPGGPRLAVISHGLWARRFARDPSVAGKKISLGNEPYTIIGVLGASFENPSDVWLPLQADPNSRDQARYLSVAARLKPRVTLQTARDRLTSTAEEFRRIFPRGLGPQESFTAELMKDVLVGNIRPSLFVLLGAVGFVLVIACTNVGNLLLARAIGRQREIATRVALGATRGHIVRQLLTESVVLSLAGGLLGLFLGHFGIRALLAINPGNIPRISPDGSNIVLDWRVLGFTLLVSLGTGLLFGLLPAVSSWRLDLTTNLKESSSQTSAGIGENELRSLLVIMEAAIAVVLLVGATLLIRTFIGLQTVDSGFNPHHVLTMKMALPETQFDKTAAVAQLIQNSEQRLLALPGVAAVASTSMLPLEQSFGLPFTIEGRPLEKGPYHGGGNWRPIARGYFDVFRIPLVRGRFFSELDDASSPRVVIINKTMAEEFWPGGSALGERITIGKGVGPQFKELPREVVGVVGDVRDSGLNRNPEPIMYVPIAQVNDGVTAMNSRLIPLAWAIRTQGEPFAMSGAIQEELRQASGGLAVSDIRSMEQVIGASTASTEFSMSALAIFAGIALILSALGIYGLLAHSVQNRTQEIGIRMALGAIPGELRNMVILQGVRPAAAGVIFGSMAALALTRFMESLLFETKTWDPLAYGLVVVVFLLCSLAAAYLPARRATRIEPREALRYE